MRVLVLYLILVHGILFSSTADFDVAVVGTSPVSLLEAIHHIRSGEKVLIIEADARFGGAWKSIDICGVAHADLGCHEIGSDKRLKSFFETQFGCHFVCLDHYSKFSDVSHADCSKGYYFSRGCDELITKLMHAIAQSHNAFIVHQKLDRIYLDFERGVVDLKMENTSTSAAKLIVTPASDFLVENPGFESRSRSQHDYHHLYLLIEDEGIAQFTYMHGFTKGLSRAMNLTPFLQMPKQNTQLIVIQTHGNHGIEEGPKLIEAFKNKGLLTQNARIIDSDVYVYQQASSNLSSLEQLGGPLIEILDSSSFAGIARYLDRWLPALEPNLSH